MNLKKLIKTKTFWTGASLVGVGIAIVIQGNLQEGITTIIGGLSVIFVRDAISKK